MTANNLDLAGGWPQDEHAYQLLITPKSTTVEAQRTAVQMLELVDTAANAIRFKHTLHLQFEGFPKDRPPECVQEVRSCLRTVHTHWPWWIHFLSPDSASWRTLLLALAPMTRGSKDSPWITDFHAARGQVMQMVRATRALHRSFEWPHATSDAIIRPNWAALKECL